MLVEEIKINLSEILAESTAYGLPRIFKSKRNFLKLFWLVFFLLGSIVSVYFTVKAINNYLEYEVIPKIEIINLYQIQFPTITFCSNGFANKTFKEICDTCSFDGDNDCRMNSENYFSKFYSYQFYEYCLQFNSGKNMSNHSIPFLNTTVGGESDYGLNLVFFQEIPSVFIYIDDIESPSFINGTRYKAAEFIFPSSGTSFDLVLTKTVENKLGLPYNVCFKYNCTKNYFENFKKKRAEKCSQYCPLECDTVDYSFSFKNFYGNKRQLRVYFDELKYTKYSEMPKTEPFSFISEMGGILGLFVGCSFVSFFEIVELFIEIYFILFNKIQTCELKREKPGDKDAEVRI